MRHTHPSPPLTRPRHDTLPASPRRLALPTHTLPLLTHSHSRLLTLPLPTLIFLTFSLSDLHLSLASHSTLSPSTILSHTGYITFFLNWKHKYKDKHGHKNVRTPSTLDIQMEVFWQQGREARAAVKVRSYPLHSLSSPHLMGISNNNWAKFCGHVPFAHTTFLLVL